MIMMKRWFLSVLAAAGALMTAPVSYAENELSLVKGEVVVESEKSFEVDVQVPDVPADEDLVLEFTAWYRAPRTVGYYPTLRLYWDGNEILDIHERPASFETNSGKGYEVRTNFGWRVPVIMDPEHAREDKMFQMHYRPRNGEWEPFLFRFLLHTDAGKHRLKVANLLKNPKGELFSDLVIRDLRLVRIKK